MKKILPLLLFALFLVSCGAHKNRFSAAPETTENAEGFEGFEAGEQPSDKENEEELSQNEELLEEESEYSFNLIETARDFLGTSYQYGGTTRAGMDCSGLVYSVFLLRDIALPRSSRAMAQLGEKLSLDRVSPGDLLFFETGRKKNVISHVGLIVELEQDKVYFIHSTTSRGVIISSLDEEYWQKHFVMARRIL